MNYSLGLIITAVGNSNGEDAFWMQMLVLVILATLLGIGSIIKTGAKRSSDQKRNYAKCAGCAAARVRWRNKALKKLKDKCLGILSKAVQPKHIIEKDVFGLDAYDTAGEDEPKDNLAWEKDLASGMEVLEVDFLLGVVENTRGDDKNNVTMRELAFSELLRRGQLKAADSNALKVYAINNGSLYEKDIQCEAMKELAERGGIRSWVHVPVVKKRRAKGRSINPVRI